MGRTLLLFYSCVEKTCWKRLLLLMEMLRVLFQSEQMYLLIISIFNVLLLFANFSYPILNRRDNPSSNHQNYEFYLVGLPESFHNLNEIVWIVSRFGLDGLFIRIFERAHERSKTVNEAKPGSLVILVCLGIFKGEICLDGWVFS